MVNDTWGAGKENQLVESKISHKLHQRSVTDMTTEVTDQAMWKSKYHYR